MTIKDFSIVTETPAGKASQEQLAMLYARYRFAADYCRGKSVLEVGCGAGLGLGLLAQAAERVVGGDIHEENLQFARAHYQSRLNVEIRKIDAHSLPFVNDSFDVVILFEAIYYLADPDQFLKECGRVLRSGGLVIVCSANKECDGFNPSPFSVKYFSALELSEWFNKQGFESKIFGGFPMTANTASQRMIQTIKKKAVRLNLIPKTMQGKEWLKRLFYGGLSEIPAEIKEGMVPYQAPVEMPDFKDASSYKVLYAAGTKK